MQCDQLTGMPGTAPYSYDEFSRDCDRREGRRVTQTQDCARGEHLYVTGRRFCPLCGEEY
jgi:hypothetical protein